MWSSDVVRKFCFVLFAELLGIMFFAGCSDPQAEHQHLVSAAVEHLSPICIALDQYHGFHGRYPADLSKLVTTGILSLPTQSPSMGRSPSDLIYQVAPEGGFYYLVVAYKFNSWVYHLHFVSFSGKWVTSKYPPAMADLIILFRGKQYRESRSWKNLDLAFDAILPKMTDDVQQKLIYYGIVTNALGTGRPCEIPSHLAGSSKQGFLYGSTNRLVEAYVISLQEMPSKTLITKACIIGNSKVLSSVYQLRVGQSEDEIQWITLYEKEKKYPHGLPPVAC